MGIMPVNKPSRRAKWAVMIWGRFAMKIFRHHVLLAGWLIAIALSLPAAGQTAANGIQWEHDARAAFARARALHRDVVIDMYADWCIECHHLDQTTYRDAQVVEWSRSQIFLKQNAEKEGTPLADRFRVDAYPTILYLDPDGNLVGCINGYLPGPQFLAVLQRFAQEARTLDASLEGTMTAADPKLQLRAASIEIVRQQYPAAARQLQRLQAVLPESSPLYSRYLLAKGVLYFRTGKNQDAVTACEGVLRHQPAPVDALFARYYRILALVQLGRRDAAKAAIQDFMTRYPADPHRQQVAALLQRLHNPFDN